MDATASPLRFDQRCADGMQHVRPLCRTYAVVVFNRQSVPVFEVDLYSSEIQWAIGCLKNGEAEVLGVWRRLTSDKAAVPDGVLAEMHDRGVQFIETGIGPGLQGGTLAPLFANARCLDSVEQAVDSLADLMRPRHRGAFVSLMRGCVETADAASARTELARIQGSDLGERYPAVVRLWREALAGFTPIFSLSEQLRALIRSTDQRAAEVRGQLTRAISRHGPFADSAVALDFVATSLARTEQRWDRERAAARAARMPRTSGGTVRRAEALGVTTLA